MGDDWVGTLGVPAERPLGLNTPCQGNEWCRNEDFESFGFGNFLGGSPDRGVGTDSIQQKLGIT